MDDMIKKRLANLLTIKSIVTLDALLVVTIMVLRELPVPPWFIELVKIIIIFYFGTQFEKAMKE